MLSIDVKLGHWLKCHNRQAALESVVRCFQPGEGPSMGLLGAYKILASGTF